MRDAVKREVFAHAGLPLIEAHTDWRKPAKKAEIVAKLRDAAGAGANPSRPHAAPATYAPAKPPM